MKLLITAIIALLASVAIALFAKDDPGYIMVNYGSWTMEASLVLVLSVGIVGYIVLYYATKLLGGTIKSPLKLLSWNSNRKECNSRMANAKGMIYLAEGNWKKAEQCLSQNAQAGELPVLNYLGAARAAQKLGAKDRRDHYLKMARQLAPRDSIAVSLTQAELLMSNGQLGEAAESLKLLRQFAPKNETILKQLAKLYTKMGDWNKLIDILPALRKNHILSVFDLDRLEQMAYAELLKCAGHDTGLLISAWHRTPRRIRKQESVLLEYSHALVGHGEGHQSEELIFQVLNKNWSDELCYLYGIIKGNNLDRQYKNAEKLLRTQRTNPVLLLTLGRLSLRSGELDKARSYLEASMHADPQPETCKELAALLEQTGEQEMAIEYYRKGLSMSVALPAQAQQISLPSNSNKEVIESRTGILLAAQPQQA